MRFGLFTSMGGQTWVRFPTLGWKVVSAHVSAMSAPPPR